MVFPGWTIEQAETEARTKSLTVKILKRLDCCKAEVNKWKRLPIKQFITNILEYMKITVSVEVTNDPAPTSHKCRILHLLYIYLIFNKESGPIYRYGQG
jgi:hypothetical protein